MSDSISSTYDYVDETSGALKPRIMNNNVDLLKILNTISVELASAIEEQIEIIERITEKATVTSYEYYTDHNVEDAYIMRTLFKAFCPITTTIGSYAFYSCSALTSVSFPVATTIGNDAFYNCSALTSVSFPVATSIGSYAFYSCSALTSVSFPAVTSIGYRAFQSCIALTSVSFPAATTIGGSAFASCFALTSASFPVATTISSCAFYYCSALTSVSLPAAKTIGSSAFQRCYNLKSLTLGASSVCTLSNSNAFSSTPIGGYSASAGTYGSIYVPASLLTNYKQATNWSYFSSRFVGY